MPVKNLVTWSSNPHHRLSGYTVIPSSGGTFVVKSTMFLDPQVFADEDAAAGVVYSVTPNITSAGLTPEEYMTPETVTARVSTWPIPTTTPLCCVTGNVSNLSGFSELRTQVRFSPYVLDLPLLGPGGFIGTDAVTVYTNYRGDFQVYLTQTIPVLIHLPGATSAGRFIVPEETQVDLRTIPLEPIVLYRNN